MTILVTGSSGWLGRHLVPILRERGDRTIGLDVAPGPFTDIVGSVADRAIVDRAFGQGAITGVVHGAALHKPDIARYPAQAFIDVNVSGTLNLLEAARGAGCPRFVFTSTTSVMISEGIRAGEGDTAVWLDEDFAPIAPRNIYGVTKLAAEGLCRLAFAEHGQPVIVLRTGRFFPEEDDTHRALSGENMKANELLNRRLTVTDAARAHLAALDQVMAIGFDIFIVSATPPFDRADGELLRRDAAAAIVRHFPDAAGLYARRGWRLPAAIDRVYDPGRIERRLGFRCETDFAAVMAALRVGAPLPFEHDADYVSPQEITRGG